MTSCMFRRVLDRSGYAIPLATQHESYLDFDWHDDWTTMRIRWSEPFYLTDFPALPPNVRRATAVSASSVTV